MDKNGIGTDATMHEHIEKIQTRQYVKKNSQSLLSPTALGYALFNGFESISRTMEYEIKNKCKRLELNSEEAFSYNLMHFDNRKMMEYFITKVSLGEYTRYYVVEKITKLMKNIYDIMVANIEQLDSSIGIFFPKWNSKLVLKNGNIIQNNVSECGFCGSKMDLFEIQKDPNGLPPLSANQNFEKVHVSREINMIICRNQLHSECQIPLITPIYKKIKIVNSNCDNCRFKLVEFENPRMKKSHRVCPYCSNFPPNRT